NAAKQSVRLFLDVGFGTVGAGGELAVPLARGVLVFDALGSAGDLLLCGGNLGGRKRIGTGGEGLRVGGPHLVSPATVVLDDLIGDPAHGSLRAVSALNVRMPRRFRKRQCPRAVRKTSERSRAIDVSSGRPAHVCSGVCAGFSKGNGN